MAEARQHRFSAPPPGPMVPRLKTNLRSSDASGGPDQISDEELLDWKENQGQRKAMSLTLMIVGSCTLATVLLGAAALLLFHFSH